MAKFKVGEIVDILASEEDYCDHMKFRLGDEGEITRGPRQEFQDWCLPGINYYMCSDCSNNTAWVAEELLRKKRPPEEARDWFDKNIIVDKEPAIA